jgi:hypothetical protein
MVPSSRDYSHAGITDVYHCAQQERAFNRRERWRRGAMGSKTVLSGALRLDNHPCHLRDIFLFFTITSL